jgi:hypothetical protein
LGDEEAAAAAVAGGLGSGGGGGLPENDSFSFMQPQDHSSTGVCGIIVADPVQPTRNICAQKRHDAESLRRLFSSGLEDMEDLFMAGSDWLSSGEVESDRADNVASLYFPLAVQKAIILNEQGSAGIRHMQGLFSGLVADCGKTPIKGDLGDSKYPDTLASSIQHIAFLIKHTEMVATTKVTNCSY